ncbi:MAG: hypothetical protein R3D78_03525 [Paracoccaceae bacterium]|jgi:hypothetical protein
MKPGVFWPFWLGLALSVVLMLAGLAQGLSAKEYFSETGPVEVAGVLLFFLGAVAIIWFAPRGALGRGWFMPVLFLLMVARELDLDKRLTDKGILQLRLYSGDYPPGQKLFGLAMVALALSVAYLLIRRGLPVMRAAWRAGERGWVAGALAGIGLLGIAKTVDGAGRKLAPWGINLSPETVTVLGRTEELFELLGGLAFLLAICLWARRNAAPGR